MWALNVEGIFPCIGVPDLKEEGEEERKRKSAEQKHSSLFGF